MPTTHPPRPLGATPITPENLVALVRMLARIHDAAGSCPYSAETIRRETGPVAYLDSAGFYCVTSIYGHRPGDPLPPALDPRNR